MRSLKLLLILVLAACGSGDVTTSPDSGGGGGADASSTIDSGATLTDGGGGAIDARIDAGGSGVDAPKPADAATGGADARPALDAAPGSPDAATGSADAGPPVMSIIEVTPTAASRALATLITVYGFNIVTGASLTLTNCDTNTVYNLTSVATVAGDGRSIAATLAAAGDREQGLYTVTVTNPGGGSDLLACAFRISAAAPPVVDAVTPNSAYAGSANDALLSDELIAIEGSGFQATPVVRFTSVDGTRSYESQSVGYITSGQLTAVIPTETLGMAPGDYHVTVQNPDLLEGTWDELFHVTTTAPPRVTDFDPVRIENGSCTSTSVVLTGTGFADNATAYYVAPAGSSCSNGLDDPNGNRLCPMQIVGRGAGTITVRFIGCPGTGPWPLAVRNPDGQLGYAYSLQVTPSADGHLNQSDFVVLDNHLVTARWKHAMAYGFDLFGHAFLYVSGGQGKDGEVLGSVEIGELDVFGTPAPFETAMQFGSAAQPRVANDHDVAREGHVLLRAGQHLYAVGGATERTDVYTVVPASRSVEHAVILGYDEMPQARALTELTTTGLPAGTWYYRVSALGPWGESLGSLEQSIHTDGGGVRVCWGAPAGATSYNIYRSLASDGRAGTTTLLATMVAGTCFNDDGKTTLAPAPGRLRGGVTTGARGAGTFTYRVSAIVGGKETHASYAAAVVVTANDVNAGNGAVQLSWDAVPGATAYRVYRRDGSVYKRLDTGALALTTLKDDGLAFTDGSPIAEIPTLPPGSLGRWTELSAAQHLTVARDGVDGVTIRLDPADGNDPIARLIVAGGREDNEDSTSYLKTAESIAVGPDGALVGVWEQETPVFDTARAFYALLTTQDRNVTAFPPPPVEPPCPDLDGDEYPACYCAPQGTSCDCDDTDPGTNPGEDDVCGDGVDQDCDGHDESCGQCTTDADGDGQLSEMACNGPDCCDSGSESSLGCTALRAPGIHVGAADACGDGIDQDCDGIDPTCPMCTTDADHDNHRSLTCGGDDCCDSGAEPALGCTGATAGGIFPGNAEICGDGIDQDCDGFDPTCECQVPDLDGDGHDSLACGGDDCCDLGEELVLGCTSDNADGIYPGAAEICSDGIDQNCSGTDLICKLPGAVRQSLAAPRPQVAGGEDVFLLAVQGDDGLTRTAAATTATGLTTFEACAVDSVTGHLDCGATWTTQGESLQPSREGLGNDALLYFDYMFPFPAAQSETVAKSGGSTRAFSTAALGRFAVVDPDTVNNNQLLSGNESASAKFIITRSHYQMTRLMSWLFVVGGMTESGQPTTTVERHAQ